MARSKSKNTRKIGGKTFRKTSCHTSKSAATKKAKTLRNEGYTARVMGKCVYKGPKRKKSRA